MAKSDEEYHFIEPESSLSYTEGPNRPQKDRDFQTRMKRRNILFILGMVMIFWALYKFMGLLFSQVKQKKSHIPPKEQVVPQKMTVVQPITAAPSAPVLSAPVSTEQRQEISSQKTRINNLESQVANMQSTLSDMNAKLSDLSSQVSKLVTQTNKFPSPIMVHRKLHAPRRHRVFGRYSDSDGGGIVYSYQLQAALPGRAWLIRSDGSTTTVSLGDKIPGYGTVILIDPDAGMIQTSSGAIIKYISQ